MKKVLIAILALVVLAAGAIFVFAQKGKMAGHFGRHGGDKMGLALRQLDLTDEQKAQVKEIKEAAQEKTGAIRDSLKTGRQQMQDLTGNGAFDEAAVTTLANSQAATRAQLTVERLRIKSQIFTILTDKQKAKAAEMKENFHGRRGKFGRHSELANEADTE